MSRTVQMPRFMPPRHPAGLSSCRGSRRGEISTRLQSERSYLRSKVPDGVSHLFPCTAGALFPEANSLLLPRALRAIFEPVQRAAYL